MTVTHRQSRTRLYRTWKKMRARCLSVTDKRYVDYGGRGITVCPEWNDFETFAAWARANGYRDDLSIEHVDNDGDYCPENCTWIPLREQSRNRRHVRYLTAFGETKSLADWARDPRCTCGYSGLVQRVNRGQNGEDAVAWPLHKTGPRS